MKITTKVFYISTLTLILFSPIKGVAGTIKGVTQEEDTLRSKKRHPQYNEDIGSALEPIQMNKACLNILHIPAINTCMDSTLTNIFKSNAPKRFKDALLPSFYITNKEQDYYLGIGARVMGTISYDFEGSIPGNGFAPGLIPVPKDQGNNNLMQYDLTPTGLFFNLVAMPNAKYPFNAYISANFSGANNGFKLDYAYMNFKDFMFGYTASFYTDAAAGPPTIDLCGPNGWANAGNFIIGYQKIIDKHLSFGTSLEMSTTGATTNKDCRIMNKRLPDLPVFLKYRWNKNRSWVRISALGRELVYRNLITQTNKNTLGYGLQLSGALQMGDRLTAYYDANYGKGISYYIKDLGNQNLDLMIDNKVAGAMTTPEVCAGFVGAKYHFTRDVFTSVVYSQAILNPDVNSINASNYKIGRYVAANVIWKITNNVNVGFEYLWGMRQNQDKMSNHANDVQVMFHIKY